MLVRSDTKYQAQGNTNRYRFTLIVSQVKEYCRIVSCGFNRGSVGVQQKVSD